MDHPLQKLEWAEPNRQETERLPGNRCHRHGMGCYLPGSQDQGALVEGRTTAPHQLPRTSCFQVLLQGQEKYPHPENGQHISNSIHQQDGRDDVPKPKQGEQRVLAMVHGEGHLRTSTTLGSEAERNSRRRIQGNEGQIRLDALPESLSCPVGEIVNFLADLFDQGYQYRSLNAYKSAISSVHEKVDGHDVGQHPMVTRLLRGAFHQRPPQPHYTQTWDVGVVTAYIHSQGENTSLSLQELSHKLAMLLALTRPSRSVDLAKLDLNNRYYSVEGVTFLPTALSKQSRQQKHGTEFHFPNYPQDELLFPVVTLREYESRTRPLRGKQTTLFIGTSKLHKPVCSSTIARWTKLLLGKAGVDTDIFKAHSVRSASTSAAAAAGVTTADILKVADWSSKAVFQKFYHKPTRDNQFGMAVLRS